MILDVVQYLNQSGFTVQPPGRGNGLTPRENYIYIKNTSGIIIPAWGCVQATGTTESGNQNYVEVDQPADVDGTAGGYLFNSFAPVEIDGFGIAFDGPLVRVLGNGTTATAGAKWTPVIDSFSIAPSAAGILTMVGNDDIETNVVKVFTAVGGSGGGVVTEDEDNPGVVTVEIDSVSTCAGETRAELGFHAFFSTILSRPFGSLSEMRRENAGSLTIFDPRGCMLDSAYLPSDFIDAIAFVSLMYGGPAFNQEYNFKTASTGVGYVNPGDDWETLRPADSCKPFGFIGGTRSGFTASIGVSAAGFTTFQVRLPERGIYAINLTYGDPTDGTYNLIQILDGTTVLRTLTDRSDPIDAGGTWLHTAEYDFTSTNRPLLKVTLNNAADADAVARDSRISRLTVVQISSPTRWEVINRCCIPKDRE